LNANAFVAIAQTFQKSNVSAIDLFDETSEGNDSDSEKEDKEGNKEEKCIFSLLCQDYNFTVYPSLKFTTKFKLGDDKFKSSTFSNIPFCPPKYC
jgi:hypothetical protein